MDISFVSKIYEETDELKKIFAGTIPQYAIHTQLTRLTKKCQEITPNCHLMHQLSGLYCT